MTSACICWLNPGPAMSLLFVVIYPRLITLNHALPSGLMLARGMFVPARCRSEVRAPNGSKRAKHTVG